MANKMKKKYKVTALVDYYLYAEIKADSKEEAEQIAEDMDGGEWDQEEEDSWGFKIMDHMTTEMKGQE